MTCNHPPQYRRAYAQHNGVCSHCLLCQTRRRKPTKRERLEAEAARMREYHLTHGYGCKTRALAIARRTA